jgi:hypothetical protein
VRYNPFDIPGYREAVQKEGEIRVAAFVSPSTSICGIPIRQMTPMDFINLNGIESPMLYGTDFSRKDITRFLRTAFRKANQTKLVIELQIRETMPKDKSG